MKFVVTVLHRSSSTARTASKTERVGEFSQFNEAVAAAKQVVNAALDRIYVAGTTAPQLLAQYEQLAQAPYIFRDDDATMNANSFNHFLYAKTRSEEMCGGTG
jgi:hypothetical protein